MITLQKTYQGAAIVLAAAASFTGIIIVSGLLGLMTLGPTIGLMEAGWPRTAYIFYGAPWLFVFWRVYKWIRWNLKSDARDRLTLPKER